MTFQDMPKKDPQGNSTGHRIVDVTGNFHLLGQTARRYELNYIIKLYRRQSDNRKHKNKIRSARNYG
jgi:hypothetical protein